jgi:hypothetical protein
MENVTIGAFATIAGVILGFALSQGAEYYKSTRDKRKMKKAVRLLMSLEIKKNYRLLIVYWNSLKKLVTKEEGEEKDIPLSSYACSISYTPFPVISRSGWDAFFEKIPESFSHEEMTHVWDFYEDLFQLAKLHKDILDQRRDSETSITRAESAPPMGKIIPYGEFLEKVEGSVGDFLRIIKGITDYGGMERIFSVKDKAPLIR